MRDAIPLLKALMLSSSQLNVLRHATDGRRRRRAAGNAIGFALLALMLAPYCVAFGIVLGMNGAADVIPVACALSLSALAFLFTLFKTNGYLFGFAGFDLLMSLPYQARTVAAVRFCCMYLRVLPYYAIVSLSLMVSYGVCAHPSSLAYPVWVLLTCLIPIIPMLAAAFVGFLVARLTAGLRLRAVVQAALMVAVTLSFMSVRLIVAGMAERGQMGEALGKAADTIGMAARLYPPAAWFAAAVTGSVPGALLLIACTALAFALVFTVVGRSYVSISSMLSTHAARHGFHVGAQRQRSAMSALVHKEWRRLTGSAVYLTNSVIGVVLALVLGVAALVVDFSEIVATVTEGAPVDPAAVFPAIPFVVHFFTGMVATTACSPSLEGRNYWIVQSLPIERERVFQAKLLFNLLLMAPPTAFANLCLSWSAHLGAPECLLYLTQGLALCALSSSWGLVCGIRHRRLEWESEVEVVKNGPAMGLYVVSNMIATMVLAVLAVVWGLSVGHGVIACGAILVASALAALCYARAMALARRA